jgi:hypothetical protein
MKVLRYILGTIGFVFVWLAVAWAVGYIVSLVFPGPGSGGFADDVINWRTLPGSVLGIWLGHQFFRFVVKAAKRKPASDKSAI